MDALLIGGSGQILVQAIRVAISQYRYEMA